MIRGHVIDSFLGMRTRVVLVDDARRQIYSPLDNGQWLALGEPGAEPELTDGDYALNLPYEMARAVYEALRAHFGDADLETARALTKARDASEVERIKLTDAVTRIALERNGLV